ncbi:AraC-like DNA-binding protein [Neorhizobium huautlense]|uniref:AraC-like DNA-binding protein n=1 Tax=Neorhizobium huautlense TaxID=67774 RepID=A0ABT9Q2R8_9HYPH|nr:AraC family transcriptional regulator [Neorhizobium huautlense]MDP9840379.1 AraC-like DNA-binding protein [Neorhizobium huautlense]
MDDLTDAVVRSERVSLRRPLDLPGVETLAAHYVRQQFKPHSHAEYLIGVITGGVHSVWCRGERHTALPGTLMSMRPGDVHHGNAAVESGWMQRMFYVDEDTMAEILGERLDISSAPLPDFKRCDHHDPLLAARLANIHDSIHGSQLTLTRDAAWAAFADVVAILAGGGLVDDAKFPVADTRAGRLVDYLHAHVETDVSLNTLSSLVSLRRRQTIDLFKSQTGLPPHAYHIGLKVRLVQDRLREGHAPAAAAMEAGFADQSHMARHFSAIVGMTPMAYARADRGRTFVL